jgi:protein ImuA
MSQTFSTVFPPRTARAHEICGDGALAFAAICAGLTAKAARRGPGGAPKGAPEGTPEGTPEGAVVWIAERWRPTVNPEGLTPYCDPGRLLVTRADSPLNVLASAETALRSGAAGLVVAEVSGAIGLTEGRRLQLAAQTGGTTVLLLIAEGAGSNAAETRWRCTGVPAPSGAPAGVPGGGSGGGLAQGSPAPRQNGHDSTHWRWSLIKNKIGTLSEWVVRWDAASRRIIVVSEAGG